MARRASKRLAALAALLLPLSAPGVAQAPPDPPAVISPLKVEPERNGVNLSTGRIDLDIPSLGVPAAPRLRFDKVQNWAPYMRGTIIAGSGEQYPVASYSVTTTGSSSESFKCFDWDCESVTKSGSTLMTGGAQHQNGTYTRAGSGEQYHFSFVSTNSAGGGTRTVQSYAARIDYPDGERITFTYDSAVCGLATCYRPNKIETNVGYFITVSYQSNDINNMGWGTPALARLFAASAPNTALQSLTYSGTTITDIGGRVWNIAGGIGSLGSKIETSQGSVQLPTEGSNSVTIGIASNAPLVGSFVRDGVAWSYTYTNPQFNPNDVTSYIYSNVAVAGPNGYSMSYAITQAEGWINVIAASTDALGRLTDYDYDQYARLTKVTLPEGNYTQVGYDDCGNIPNKTSVAKTGSGLSNIVESAVYPTPSLSCSMNEWRPSSSTDARGKVTNYSWNSGGQLTQQDDPADASGVRRRTIVEYTLTGSLSRKSVVRVCAAGATPLTCSGNALSRTEYTYVGSTLLPATITEKDEATGTARVTTYTYDSAGRALSVQGPQNGVNGTQYFRYDVHGRKTWEIGAADANGLRLAKRFTYRDSDDKVTKVETGTIPDPNGTTLTLLEQADTTYDSRRYPIREARSAGGSVRTVTDRSFLDRGLADCTTVRMNLAALPAPTSTSACNVPAVVANPDRVAKNVYDNAGQLTTIQKALGVTTANGFPQTLQQDYVSYAYTNNSKQQFVTDANGNKAQYKYDGFDRLQCWILPSKITPGTVSGDCVAAQPAGGDYEKYTYDAAGNRLSLRRRDGRTLTFAYDNLNRMLSKLVPDGCPPIQPPGTGCPAASATRDVFYSYDLLGRQLTAKFDSTSGADGVTNSYDAFGNVASSTISISGFTKTVSSLYDADNNRTRVTHPDGQAFTYTYDARDRPTGIAELGQPAMIGFGYDAAGRPSQLSRTNARQTLYQYDPISRPEVLINTSFGSPSDVRFDYAFNPASQIVTQARSNDSYAFTAIASANKAYSVNGLNQYSAVAGSTYLYDANGNLTHDGIRSYVYDAENRLVSVQWGPTFTYDPLGRLVEVSQAPYLTRFLYDGDALVADYDGSGAVVRRYVHGPNAAADDPLVQYDGPNLAARRFLETDHQGSVILISDANGGTLATNRYDEYGVPQAGNTGRFQYTGQQFMGELSMTGQPHAFYYYKARIYRADIGRFLQVDPIGYDDQINLYAYVGNDPVNANDPEGQQLESVMDRRNQAMLQAMDECEGRGAECAAAIGEGVGVAATAVGIALPIEGLAIKALPWVGRGLSSAGRALGAGRGSSSFARAAAAFPKQLAISHRMPTSQLQRSLRSFERNVAEHKEWLKDPTKKIPDFHQRPPTEQRNILHHWKQDVKRNEAYRDIAKGVLKEREQCTGTRLC